MLLGLVISHDHLRMKPPLVLFSGFLGAGKTTVLRKLLPLLRAKRIPGHVIINDYGNAVFDAELLRDEAASLEEVTGSCVCCESLDFLLAAVQQIRPTKPAVILVETNGTTDVPSLLEVLAMSRSTRHCTPPVQVAVVDADCWQQRGEVNDLEIEQVSTASYIVISWQDACSPERLADVRQQLRKINPRHREVTPDELATRLAGLSVASSLQVRAPTGLNLNLMGSTHPHHHHDEDAGRYHFSAMEVVLSPTLSREHVMACLSRLPPNVLRAKGMVCLEDEPESIFFAQKASPHAPPTLMPLPRLKPPSSMLVFIGAALDQSMLRSHVQPLLRYQG